MELFFCFGPIDATPEFRLRKIPDSWLLRLWRCVADTKRGKGTGSCAGRLKRCIGVYHISIYICDMCIYIYICTHRFSIYIIYIYTCKTPSEWWLGRSTIIRHGSLPSLPGDHSGINKSGPVFGLASCFPSIAWSGLTIRWWPLFLGDLGAHCTTEI